MGVNAGKRFVAHVDLDAFFASVEQRDHPELRGKPVAVGAGSARGVVMAASYEARAFGVHSAMPTAWARRRCPELQVVPARFSAYQEASAAVRAIFERVTDLVEPLALDEAFLDLSEPIGHPDGRPGEPLELLSIDDAAAVAMAIQAAIEREVGLTASAGVASGKFLAKVASGVEKPGGLTVVRPEEALDFLAQLPIERFFGVGPKTAARLQELGVHRGADLILRSEAELIELLGKHGAFLYRVVRNNDPRPVVPDRARKSMGAERTFASNVTTVGEFAPELAKACANVAARLENMAMVARTVTVKFRYSDFSIVTRSLTPAHPVANAEELWAVAEHLVLHVPRPQGDLRLIGVSVSHLFPRHQRVVQGGLFP